MAKEPLNRKEFFQAAGRLGFGACLCGVAGGLGTALAGIQAQPQPGEKTKERAVKRMEFADTWLKRFFNVVDQTLDEDTRKKLMMLNGKTCYRDWIKETKQAVRKVDFEEWAKKVSSAKHRDVSVEGNVIHYQYGGSAETGGAIGEGICLCPMAEGLPAGLSPTYCYCSLGYVKEIFELQFGRKVEVELVDSVLRGAKRCQFKITVV